MTPCIGGRWLCYLVMFYQVFTLDHSHVTVLPTPHTIQHTLQHAPHTSGIKLYLIRISTIFNFVDMSLKYHQKI